MSKSTENSTCQTSLACIYGFCYATLCSGKLCEVNKKLTYSKQLLCTRYEILAMQIEALSRITPHIQYYFLSLTNHLDFFSYYMKLPD